MVFVLVMWVMMGIAYIDIYVEQIYMYIYYMVVFFLWVTKRFLFGVCVCGWVSLVDWFVWLVSTKDDDVIYTIFFIELCVFNVSELDCLCENAVYTMSGNDFGKMYFAWRLIDCITLLWGLWEWMVCVSGDECFKCLRRTCWIVVFHKWSLLEHVCVS